MDNLFDNHVPLLRPWLGEEEIDAVADVIRSGWISQGQVVADFEKIVCDYVGARQGVATNSATSALHLILRLSGVGPGDKVICPSFTCMATANAIHHCGAEPKFADIDPKTYNLDPESIEHIITPDVKALLIVHQIGLSADVDSLTKLAKKFGMKVVEDAATAFGASYKGRMLGGLGAPTAFSFHPRKMVTTGEGGMITTDDSMLAEKARCLRATGASISDLERHKARGVLVQEYHDFGYNYRMTDMQAAIGIVQMKKVGPILAERRRIAACYNDAFAGIENLHTPFVPSGSVHAFSSYMIRILPGARISRNDFLKAMAEKGISCRIGIQPLHWEPFYRDRMRDCILPVTEAAARETVFLPIFPGMADSEIDQVVHAVKQLLCDEG